MTRLDLLREFKLFIATEEGYYKPGSVAQRQQNPGNLTVWGNWPTRAGYVDFTKLPNGNPNPTPDVDGWAALEHQISVNIFTHQCTFRSFFAGQRDSYGRVLKNGYYGYCPAPIVGDRLTKGNDPETYAQKAVEWINHKLGVSASPDTLIESLVA